jgi:hypothetical protein
MSEYTKKTDEFHLIQLESRVAYAVWNTRIIPAGEKLGFEVWTHFVGAGSKIEIKVEDKKGKSIAKQKGQVFGNYFAGSIIVPKKAREEITFTAKLPDHGLEMKSAPAIVIPLFKVTNQKWGQKEARGGDVVKLMADVEGVPDEMELLIHIYEYDQDGAHDFITKFPCRVKAKKIEAEWEYEYHEDTDEIPTEEEMKKYGGKYNPPEYFWVAELGGKRFGDEQESGLLEFKDWIEFRFEDDAGNPMADEDYRMKMPDGSEEKGKTDKDGFVKVSSMSPGNVLIELVDHPDIKIKLGNSYDQNRANST